MKQWVVLCLMAGALTTACAPGVEQPAPEPPKPRVVKPVTTDGEIYYFPVTGDDYRASLSAFRKAHPELRCQYFGADDERKLAGQSVATTYSRIVGHTIVCRDPAQNAQEVTVP